MRLVRRKRVELMLQDDIKSVRSIEIFMSGCKTVHLGSASGNGNRKTLLHQMRYRFLIAAAPRLYDR